MHGQTAVRPIDLAKTEPAAEKGDKWLTEVNDGESRHRTLSTAPRGGSRTKKKTGAGKPFVRNTIVDPVGGARSELVADDAEVAERAA